MIELMRVVNWTNLSPSKQVASHFVMHCARLIKTSGETIRIPRSTSGSSGREIGWWGGERGPRKGLGEAMISSDDLF